MESLGEVIKRIGPDISKRSTAPSLDAESTNSVELECHICKGAGFVHPKLQSGAPDFTRVVPCECAGMESEEGRALRLRRDSGDLRLKLLSSMTFENFDHRRVNLQHDQQQNLGDAYKLARRFAEKPEGWVVLQGTNGCGKTHLAAAIGNYQIQKGKPVFFKVVPDLLDYLRAAFKPDSGVTSDELFEKVKTVPLLILDDFGEQATTPWAQEKLYQLINHRYNDRLPMVITTCLPIEDIEDRILSRMVDPRVSVVFDIEVPDYRADHTPTERGKRRRTS
jgi:DNA replication protein DnaC